MAGLPERQIRRGSKEQRKRRYFKHVCKEGEFMPMRRYVVEVPVHRGAVP